MRRLLVLLWALPWESETKHQLRLAHEKSLKPTPEHIRERAEFYKRQREAGEV